MGGKVLVPTRSSSSKLVAARLAADVMRRADRAGRAHRRRCAPTCSPATSTSATAQFLTGERTAEGFFGVRGGLEQAIARGLAYAPYADLLWCETSQARSRRGQALRRGDPRASSRASCWPTTARPRSTGRRNLDDATIARVPARAGARWATSSSSSRWPASTRSTSRCSSWRAATASAAWRPTRSCRRREFAAEAHGYTRDAAPARGRHRLLRRGADRDLRRQSSTDGA